MTVSGSLPRKSAGLLFGLALATAMGVGLGVAVAAGPVLHSPTGLTPEGGASSVSIPAAEYPKNAQGQTFGSAADAASPDQEPDLILVVATNGREGYVRKVDLDEANGQAAAESFTSPEDALAWQEAEGRGDRSVPVYEHDGVTQVGTFLVLGGDNQRRVAEDEAK